MTGADVEQPGVAAVYADDPRLEPLIGPGGAVRGRGDASSTVSRCGCSSARRARSSMRSRWAPRTPTLDHLVHEDERLTFGDVRRQVARPRPRAAGVVRRPRRATASRSRCATCPSSSSASGARRSTERSSCRSNSWWTGPELELRAPGRRCDGRVPRRRAARTRRRRRPTRRGPCSSPCAPYEPAASPAPTRGSTSWWTVAPLDESAIARLDPDDPVTILYTSGTTGRPKGALGTNRGQIANIWNMAFVAATRVAHHRSRTRHRHGSPPRWLRSRCSTSAGWRRSSGARSADRRS